METWADVIEDAFIIGFAYRHVLLTLALAGLILFFAWPSFAGRRAKSARRSAAPGRSKSRQRVRSRSQSKVHSQ